VWVVCVCVCVVCVGVCGCGLLALVKNKPKINHKMKKSSPLDVVLSDGSETEGECLATKSARSILHSHTKCFSKPPRPRLPEMKRNAGFWHSKLCFFTTDAELGGSDNDQLSISDSQALINAFISSKSKLLPLPRHAQKNRCCFSLRLFPGVSRTRCWNPAHIQETRKLGPLNSVGCASLRTGDIRDRRNTGRLGPFL